MKGCAEKEPKRINKYKISIYRYKNIRVLSVHPVIHYTVKCPMNPTANVIDFASYRKRKQAQQRARAMWEMYARNAGLQAFQWVQAAQQATETRHA
ncbi:hypothetical protein QF019_002339 [Pseudomonas frederiksbergensis]